MAFGLFTFGFPPCREPDIRAPPVRRCSVSVGNQSTHSDTPSLPAKDYSVSDLQLATKSIFSMVMPRYPNVWFYLSRALAPTHEAAVAPVTTRLQQCRSSKPRNVFSGKNWHDILEDSTRGSMLLVPELNSSRSLSPLATNTLDIPYLLSND
jgi:hypothetical protein